MANYKQTKIGDMIYFEIKNIRYILSKVKIGYLITKKIKINDYFYQDDLNFLQNYPNGLFTPTIKMFKERFL